jgi:hypothetical protein
MAFREQLISVRGIKSRGDREKEADLSKPPARFVHKSIPPATHTRTAGKD